MSRSYAQLVGGPLDGGRHLIQHPEADEIEVPFDHLEAMVETIPLYLYPYTREGHSHFVKRLREARERDARAGWRILLYCRGNDGRYYFVRKVRAG
jgi:hypothetical protein